MGAYADHRRPAPPRPDRRGPVHRSVAVGGRPRAHGRGTARVGHATSASRARNGNHDRAHGAARDLQEPSATTTSGSRSPSAPRTSGSALCQAMGQPGLATDARFARAELRKQNEAALDEIITAWTSDARPVGRRRDACSGRAWPRFPSMSNQTSPKTAPDRAGLPGRSSIILSSAAASTPASLGRCRERLPRPARGAYARRRH